ncbi:MAG: hypothetical protein Q4C96_03485 [Planctomycetia bacterium]|nr:hypothetical protein [Planctomycetia bacterium]
MITKEFLSFLGMLVILVGIQVYMTERVFLTSQFTRALAERKDPSITRKTWLYEAVFGEPAKIPEKEVLIPEWVGYMIIFTGGMMCLQSTSKSK